MNKFLLTVFFFIVSGSSYSQTCEEKNDQLLMAVRSFSAATLYNTYATIGSISDGFVHKVYDAETVIGLLDAQIKLTENLSGVFEKLLSGKIMQSVPDSSYSNVSIEILNGLKKQALILKEYTQLKKQKKLSEYEDQRKNNWSAISRLMGISE